MKKQTAVSLIAENFNLLSDKDFKSWFLNSLDYLTNLEQQQIMNAYDSGFILCHEISLFVGVQENDLQGQAEHYYTQTFTPKND